MHGSPAHVAPLSIHTTLAGREVYLAGPGRFAVEPGRYLLLNAGQTAASFIAPGGRIDSLSVLFSRAFAADVLRAITTADDVLLDDPSAASAPPPTFFERTYPADPLVARALVRARANALTPAALEEALHELLEAIVSAHRGARAESERVPAMRPATRRELYRRLCRARDFLAASLGAPLLLEDLARVACLAPHRLLRLYRDTFGETPHRDHVRRRLEHARVLLSRGMPVGEAGRAIGFESLGSFSTLFRRRYGVSPRDLHRRRQKAISEN